MNNFLDLAKERYSCRKFSTQKVEEEKIELIIEAGKVAPTAKNMQPQQIVVFDDPVQIEKLKKCTNCIYGAPLVIAVCYDKEKCWYRDSDNKPSGDIDASIIATHMMFEAQELGLGSTWVMWFNQDVLKQEFNVADNIEITALLVIGYPSSEAHPSGRHTDRIPSENNVKRNKF